MGSLYAQLLVEHVPMQQMFCGFHNLSDKLLFCFIERSNLPLLAVGMPGGGMPGAPVMSTAGSMPGQGPPMGVAPGQPAPGLSPHQPAPQPHVNPAFFPPGGGQQPPATAGQLVRVTLCRSVFIQASLFVRRVLTFACLCCNYM